jgi:hypothetical protein
MNAQPMQRQKHSRRYSPSAVKKMKNFERVNLVIVLAPSIETIFSHSKEETPAS